MFNLLFVYFSLGIISLIIIGVFVYVLWKRYDKKSVPKAGKATHESSFKINRQLLLSFKHGFLRLRRIAGSRRGMYDIPTMLMVGPQGSGKSSLMQHSGFDFINTMEDIDEQSPCQFWNTTYGSLIEVPGAYATGTMAAPTYKSLYKCLLRYRPKKLLDGIVFVVSADSLLDETLSDELMDAISQLRLFILKCQQQLPVFLVVTKSDTIAGFSQLAALNKTKIQNLIFGWSNDRDLDKAYSREDISDDVDRLLQMTHQLRLNLIANRHVAENYSALFMLNSNLALHKKSIIEVMQNLIAVGGFLPKLKYRGVYFSGHANPGKSLQLAFSNAMFRQKVFKDYTVAIPDKRPTIKKKFATRMALLVGVTALFFTGLFVLANHQLNQKLLMVNVLLKNDSRMISYQNSLRNTDTISTKSKAEDQRKMAQAMMFVLNANYPSLVSILMPLSYIQNINATIIREYIFKDVNLVMLHFSRHFIANLINIKLPMLVEQSRQEIQAQSLTASLEFKPIQDFSAFIAKLLVNVHYLDKIYSHDYPPAAMTKKEAQKYYEFIDYTLGQAVAKAIRPFLRSALFWHTLADITPYNILAHSMHTALIIEKWYMLVVLSFDHALQKSPLVGAPDMLVSLLSDLGTKQQSKEDLVRIHHMINALNAFILKVKLKGNYVDDDALFPLLAHHIKQIKADKRLYQLLTPSIAKIKTHAVKAMNQAVSNLLDQSFPFFGQIVHLDSNKQVSLNKNLLLFNDFLGQMLEADVSYGVGKSVIQKEETAIPMLFLLNKQQLENINLLTKQLDSLLLGHKKSGTNEQYTLKRLNKNTVDYYIGDHIRSSLIGLTQNTTIDSKLTLQEVHNNLQQNLMALSLLSQSLHENKLYYAQQVLSEVIFKQSNYILTQVDDLLQKEQLYLPNEQALDWHKFHIPLAYKLYGVSDKPVLDQYLLSQYERMAYLAGMAQSALTASGFIEKAYRQKQGKYSALLGQWLSIAQQMKEYKTKNPKSSLRRLEQYITGPLMLKNGKACQSTSNIAPTLEDYFQTVLYLLNKDVMAYCEAMLTDKINRAYHQLRGRFNQHLANAFPFVSIYANQGEQDLDAATLIRFVVNNEALINRLKTEVAQFPKHSAQVDEIAQFVNMLDTAIHFLVVKEKGQHYLNQYRVMPYFRVNKQAEVNANQIAEWSLHVGAQSMTWHTKIDPLLWRYGSPVGVYLRWAINAPFAPVAIATDPYQAVSHDTLSYRYHDNWSLLRFLRQYQVPMRFTERKPYNMLLRLNATIAKLPGVTSYPSIKNFPYVEAYIGISVLNAKTKAPALVPVFPYEAKALVLPMPDKPTFFHDYMLYRQQRS